MLQRGRKGLQLTTTVVQGRQIWMAVADLKKQWEKGGLTCSIVASLHLLSCSCVAKEIREGDQIKSNRRDGQGLTLKCNHV